jgi:hypothetical protein
MLLALQDYTAYRFRRGRYSKNAIEAMGGKLAIAANFTGDQAPKPGDIIIVHTRDSFISWLVMYFTNSVWSHTAMAVDNGDIHDVTTYGTFVHPFADFLNGADYLYPGRQPLTNEGRARLVAVAREHGDAQFSWLSAIKIGGYEVIGRSRSTNLRLYIDVLNVLLVSAYLTRKRRRLNGAVLSLIFQYLIVLAANTRYRRGRVFQQAKPLSPSDPSVTK